MKKHSLGLWVVLSSLFLCGVARGTPIEFTASLSGAAESPSNASPGIGAADVVYDADLQTLRVVVTFSGLTGLSTASHIHAATALAGTGTAGVATQLPTFIGFPLGVNSGSYDHTFDLTLSPSFNLAFVTANGGTAASAEAALVAAMLDGKAYLNIHSSTFGGGEIRGFLTAVPDSSATAAMLIFAFFAMVGFFRYQRAQAVAMVK